MIKCTHFLRGVRKLYQNRYLHTANKGYPFGYPLFVVENGMPRASRIAVCGRSDLDPVFFEHGGDLRFGGDGADLFHLFDAIFDTVVT